MSSSVSFTAAQIAEKLHGEVVGDGSVQLTSFAPADSAKVGDLTFVPRNNHTLALLNKARLVPFSSARRSSPQRRSSFVCRTLG